MSERVIWHLIVKGRVQGVGYRAFVEHEAQRRQLEGWVRNRRDGSVEIVVAGAPSAVEYFIDACRRGPFAARVSEIDQREGTADDLFMRRGNEAFSVLPTL